MSRGAITTKEEEPTAKRKTIKLVESLTMTS